MRGGYERQTLLVVLTRVGRLLVFIQMLHGPIPAVAAIIGSLKGRRYRIDVVACDFPRAERHAFLFQSARERRAPGEGRRRARSTSRYCWRMEAAAAGGDVVGGVLFGTPAGPGRNRPASPP